MKILYQAKDGKIFDNEDECCGYEYKLEFPEIFNICFYDKDGLLYHINEDDIFNDDYYFRAEKVDIYNKTDLIVFRKLARECGWCEFTDQITSPGTWIRKDDNKLYGIWELEKEVNKNAK